MVLRYILLTRLLIICTLTSQFESCAGETVSAHYLLYPEVGLKVLSCLSQHVEYNRAVRVHNTTSNICEMLDAEWNSNPLFDSGFIYMQMLSYHQPLHEDFRVNRYIPEDFEAGSRVDVVFRTPSFVVQRFNVKVQDYKGNTTFIEVAFVPFDNETLLRSHLYENRTEDIVTTYPNFSGNTAYTVTVYYYVTHWGVFLDGTHIYNYSHVYPFVNTGKEKARFWSHDVLCQSITFHWP